MRRSDRGYVRRQIRNATQPDIAGDITALEADIVLIEEELTRLEDALEAKMNRGESSLDSGEYVTPPSAVSINTYPATLWSDASPWGEPTNLYESKRQSIAWAPYVTENLFV